MTIIKVLYYLLLIILLHNAPGIGQRQSDKPAFQIYINQHVKRCLKPEGRAIIANISHEISMQRNWEISPGKNYLTGGISEPFTSHNLIKERWVFYVFALIAMVFLCINLVRWKKYNFRTGIILRAPPLIRLVTGLFISTIPLIAIGIYFNIPVREALDLQPDIVWSAIIILVAGIVSSLARYFGTFARKAMLISGKERQLII